MRIAASSDFHGMLPDYPPNCDLVVIAGDICPNFKVGGHFSIGQADPQLRWIVNVASIDRRYEPYKERWTIIDV